jgi:hypothetical protein
MAKPMGSHYKRGNQQILTTRGKSPNSTKINNKKRKKFFPIIKDRLTTKIKLSPNFTATVTAHGKTKAYLHRFKIIESPECPCDGGNQTMDHILYGCIKLQREREQLIHNLSNHDSWPVEKSALVKKKHIKHFIQ